MEDAGQVENSLLQRCQQGEVAAFRELVDKYQRLALGTAYGIIGNFEDARDISQEAFARIYRSIDKFRTGKNFSTWLCRIVINLAIDYLRKRAREAKALARKPDLSGTSFLPPDCAVEKKELKDTVRRVIASLPVKYRTVLVLRDLNGLDCAEIARVLRCPPATVRWRLHRAREMFRNHWRVNSSYEMR